MTYSGIYFTDGHLQTRFPQLNLCTQTAILGRYTACGKRLDLNILLAEIYYAEGCLC